MLQKSSIFFLVSFMIISSATNSSKIKQPGNFQPLPASHKTTVSNSEELEKLLLERKAARFVLGRSLQGRTIDAYFFPGKSEKRALVIGGVHGSELSSIEVAKALMQQLMQGDSIFYNVIVIPSLFPDNAEMAKQNFSQIGGLQNTGRYSYPGAIDPNRQMPTPGKAFDEDDCVDHAGRKIENENTLLLELIGQYRPQRIVNLHAIRDVVNAGVYADPRTDHKGIALGYATDSSLAIAIAAAIHQQGGFIPGNRLNKKPTALYYKDPVAVPAGMFQKRNFTGSSLPGKRGGGVSLGTWASTAVHDEEDPSKNRDAIRIITMEFPGSKRPVDHKKELQAFYQRQVEVYAAALRSVFLGDYFTETFSPAKEG
ncbi:MAG: M14 family zinc carboxypeptidase [Chitinophagaceae bacterium]